ncbi:serine/threonine-protein kinase [Polymorphospora sp. NPDC051019]|uniref:serine/threonine-protein kinase n=1 Tax=Polymorphospora sp. NPDC051019 TaxID=3155725 RepID=UPI00342D2F47
MSTPESGPAELPTSPPTHRVPAPPEAAIGPAPPMQLGRGYLKEELIGTGASGAVWRGRRREDNEPVAIKELHAGRAGDRAVLHRFLREREVLLELDHPHLVRLYDMVAERNTLAIVMELVTGQNLRQVMRRQPLSTDRALSVLSQLAAALGAVHAAGVTHRDVKPENILVTWRGGEPWIQLVDFGVAKFADGLQLTRVSEVVGTPHYVAPEASTGRPHGPPVDIYALGLVAYELLGGRHPYAGSPDPLAAHIVSEPARLAGVAEPLWQLINACLDKNPDRRPTADAFAAHLDQLRHSESGLPADAPPPRPAGPPAGQPVQTADPVVRPDPARADVPGATTGPATGPETGESVGGAPVDAQLPTTGATVLLPDPPPPAPVRRRGWRKPVLALAALLLVATGGGWWVGRPDPGPVGTLAATPSGPPPPQFVLLPVTATSPRRGTVRLEFSDATHLDGFVRYVILRDGSKVAEVASGSGSPYVLHGIDHRTEYCFQVAALVESTQPLPPAPKPSCLTADG